MERVAAMRRLYELINAGDIDGFGDQLADGFVEHGAVPGLEPTKEGVKQLFRMYRASFPDLRMDVEEVLPSGDNVVGRMQSDGPAHWRGLHGPARKRQERRRAADRHHAIR